MNVLWILKVETYSDRLKHYFETLAEYHARPKDVFPGHVFVNGLDPEGENLCH